MNFTMPGLKPTWISEGLGGNSFDSTHLARTYGLDKPHEIDQNAVGLAQLFSATDRYQDKPLIGMTEAKGNKTILSSDSYTWKLRGHQKIKLRVTEVTETATSPGRSGLEFKIVLDKPWFQEPDIIIGENNEYPLEVIGTPEQRGLGWEYKVVMMGEDNSRSFPTALFQTGREFCKVGTTIVREDNNKYGTMQFNTIFALRSQTGMVAEKFQFTDRMLRVDKNSSSKSQIKHWRVPFMDANGKTYANFMPMVEAELWNQVYEDIEWALNFGRQGTKVGYNGYLKKTSPGLRQILNDGHTLTHNGNLTLTQLDEWLSSIYRGRKDANANARKVVLSTGEMGAIMFHNMVATDASQFLTVDSNYIAKNPDVRHLSFGAQFTHYVGKNGLDVTVMLDPAKDNPDWCPQVHPVYTDTTIDSWRMDILDFGLTKEQTVGNTRNNIEMVCEDNADVYFCTHGKWNKSGFPINDGSQGLSGGVSGYASMIEKSFGLMVRDVSRCGVIKMEFDDAT